MTYYYDNLRLASLPLPSRPPLHPPLQGGAGSLRLGVEEVLWEQKLHLMGEKRLVEVSAAAWKEFRADKRQILLLNLSRAAVSPAKSGLGRV